MVFRNQDTVCHKHGHKRDNSFQPQPKPSVQIHYTGHSHWAISFQVMDDDKVYVLDSLYNYL